MREITQENLNKLVVKKSKEPRPIVGQDILYVCSTCGHTEKEYALSSRNYKFCNHCNGFSVKSSLLPTLDWVHSDIQVPEYGD
jgi:DNA replicative helicase MCM subunit Mcm2 (Cdc46/Mcm family)